MTDHLPPDALDSLGAEWLRMIRLVQSALGRATATLAAMASPDPVRVRDVQRTRNGVDLSYELHRRLAALGETVTVRTAVDISLAARCLARCAEHIVSLARHLTLLHDTTSTA